MCKPYLGQIWYATVGQWPMLTGLCHLYWLLCRPCKAKKTAEVSQFRPNFHILRGSCAHPLGHPVQIWQESVDTRSTLTCQKIHLNLFIVSPSRDKKIRNFGQILTFGGSPVHRFILLPYGAKKPETLPFFGLRHFEVSPVGSNQRKLNACEQLQTFPYQHTTVLRLFGFCPGQPG